MRIAISHETSYRYAQPAKSVIQTLRLTPRSHVGQHVARWRIDLSQDVHLAESEDAFGNICHVFTLMGPVTELHVSVQGEVETQDVESVIAGAIERFPPSLYLRDTPLTTRDAALSEYARDIAPASASSLEVCHALMTSINAMLRFDTDPTHVATTAAESFAMKRGVCQDLTQVFIACARGRGIPARYVGGHMVRGDGVTELDAGHAWAEVYIENLGWVSFDPTNCLCPTDRHVRVAIGLDYLGASPVRGTQIGGGGETMKVAVDVREQIARRQMMYQAQN